jgi:hypothetical protein
MAANVRWSGNASRFKFPQQSYATVVSVMPAINQVADSYGLPGLRVKSPVPLMDQALLHQRIEPMNEFLFVHGLIIA